MARGHDYLYSDIPETLYVEGLSAGSDTIDLTVTSTDKTFKGIVSNSNVTNNGIYGNASDAVVATAVSGNLTMVGVSEDDELYPGGFVVLNNDDDNNNGTADREDSTAVVGENDLVSLTISPLAPNLGSDTGKYTLSFDSSNIKIWGTADKTGAVASEETEWDATLTTQLFVEGVSFSSQLASEHITLVWEESGSSTKFDVDQVAATVGGIDLEVDQLDEILEEAPGAIIWRNSDFSKKLLVDNQPEAGLDLYAPDYSEPGVFDINYLEDYTLATISFAEWMVDTHEILFESPPNGGGGHEYDFTLWTLTEWEGFINVPATDTTPEAWIIPQHVRLTPESKSLKFYIEGIENSLDFAFDSLDVHAVPKATSGSSNDSLSVPYYDDSVIYTVVETNVGVDGNRDTTIDIANSHDRQLTFWYNNDNDIIKDGYEQEGVDTATRADSNDDQINQKRDLEDFALIQVAIDKKLIDNAFDTSSLNGSPTPGQLKVTYRLAIENAGGSTINLYYTADQSAIEHVSNAFRANVQVNDSFFNTAAHTNIGDTQLKNIIDGINAYLFEAKGELSADPTLIFTTKIEYADGSTTEKQHEIDLHLSDFKEFYDLYQVPFTEAEREKVDHASLAQSHFNDANLEHASSIHGQPFFNEDENIVLVHGWNMTDSSKKAFGETAFKRLYWQGFAGHFIQFDWPTYYDGASQRYWPDVLDLTYNASEYQAFRSGRALKNLLANQSGDTHLLAHSMGNVVAGEALRQWRANPSTNGAPLVATYVAMQAAVSAGAYGDNSDDWTFTADAKDLYRDFGAVTPAPYFLGANVSTNANTLAANHALVGNDAVKWVNMYNPTDIATREAWLVNNEEKGTFSQVLGVWDWLYDHHILFAEIGPGLFRFKTSYFFPQNPIVDLSDFVYSLFNGNSPGKNGYEAIAFLSQSKSHTVGTKTLPWWFHNNKDISSWLPPEGIVSERRQNHSFQFHYDAATTWDFWKHVKVETSFNGTY